MYEVASSAASHVKLTTESPAVATRFSTVETGISSKFESKYTFLAVSILTLSNLATAALLLPPLLTTNPTFQALAVFDTFCELE